MNEVDGLIEVLRAQVQVVQRLSQSDLVLPSACAGWTVKDVLQHSVGVTQKFTEFAAGVTDHPRTPDGDLLRPDPWTALERTADAACDAWGVADMGRLCHLPFGSFPAFQAAGINLFDVLAHSWDVSVVADVTMECPDDLWVAGLHAAQAVLGEHRDPRQYSAQRPLAPGDGAAGRFLGYLGRTYVRRPRPSELRPTSRRQTK